MGEFEWDFNQLIDDLCADVDNGGNTGGHGGEGIAGDKELDAGYLVDPELLKKWGGKTLEALPDSQVQLQTTLWLARVVEARWLCATIDRVDLSEMLPELPPANIDVHIVTTGRGKSVKAGDVVKTFGFGNFIEYITELWGDGCVVYLSTWSLNKDHAFMLLELLESGRIAELHVLIDATLTYRKRDIVGMLWQGIKQFPGSRLMFFQNHSKVYCFRDKDNMRQCTVTGSSNLSGLPRAENYVLSTSPELYAHYVNNFFEAMFDLDLKNNRKR